MTRLVNKPWGYVLAVPLTTYTKAADNATFDAALMLVMGVCVLVIGILLTDRSWVPPQSRRRGDPGVDGRHRSPRSALRYAKR